MILDVDGTRFSGAAIDLVDHSVSARAVYRAVHGQRDGRVSIECPAPTPVHDHVGVVATDARFKERVALAVAGRTRGVKTVYDDELARVNAELDAIDLPTVDVATAKRRFANAGEREAVLGERVATLQGRVQARRDLEAPVATVQGDLEDALQAYTTVQTERIAAEQALEKARARARKARDRREERLQLEDRAGNLRRRARASLVDAVQSPFEDALEVVPGRPADTVTRMLAVARIADLRAPVVCAVDRFDSVERAAAVLDASVIRV